MLREYYYNLSFPSILPQGQQRCIIISPPGTHRFLSNNRRASFNHCFESFTVHADEEHVETKLTTHTSIGWEYDAGKMFLSSYT